LSKGGEKKKKGTIAAVYHFPRTIGPTPSGCPWKIKERGGGGGGQKRGGIGERLSLPLTSNFRLGKGRKKKQEGEKRARLRAHELLCPIQYIAQRKRVAKKKREEISCSFPAIELTNLNRGRRGKKAREGKKRGLKSCPVFYRPSLCAR